MTLSRMDRMLIELLERRTDDGRGADLSDERVWAVLCEGSEFDENEKLLLATSPLARETYALGMQELEIKRRATLERWKRAGLQTQTTSLLAASADRYPIVVSTDDFEVVVRQHPTSEGWTITLALGETFHRNIGPNEGITLLDDANVSWVRGAPNVYGEIHSYKWPYDESPVERMRKPGFTLRVEHV